MNLLFSILLLVALNSCNKPKEELPDDNKVKPDSGNKCGCDTNIQDNGKEDK